MKALDESHMKYYIVNLCKLIGMIINHWSAELKLQLFQFIRVIVHLFQ